ncbi:MAG: hypothetical protein P1V34_00950 [Alphaproteobacteria bacterium]|nr:hypothetical protein [Alphaproteobacteria bacterium]
MNINDDRLMDGYQLTVVLEPDTSNPSLAIKMSPYLENYPMPFLCGDGTRVIGATCQSCRSRESSNGQNVTTGFFYVEGFPIYMNYSINTAMSNNDTGSSVMLNGIEGYKRADYIYDKKMSLIWDLNGNVSLDSVRSSLNAGLRHQVVFKDRYGYIRSYPVDLFFAFHDDSPFHILTQAIVLPSLFFDPLRIFQLLIEKFQDTDVIRKQNFAINFKTNQYNTFHKIFATGTVSDGTGDADYKTDFLRVFAY